MSSREIMNVEVGRGDEGECGDSGKWGVWSGGKTAGKTARVNRGGGGVGQTSRGDLVGIVCWFFA